MRVYERSPGRFIAQTDDRKWLGTFTTRRRAELAVLMYYHWWDCGYDDPPRHYETRYAI